MTQRSWGRVALILLSVLVLHGGCSRKQPVDIRELVPDLSDEMAHHLTEDNEDAFRRYTAEAGRDAASRAFLQLMHAPSTDSLELFVEEEARLAPYLRKLSDALAVNFNWRGVRKSDLAYERSSDPRRFEIARLRRRQRDLVLDSAMPIEQQAPRYLELIELCLPYADVVNVAELYAGYANLLPRLGKRELMPTYLNLGVEAAVRNEDFVTASQLLGTLGVFYSGNKDYKRMGESWNRGLHFARQAQSWQEARILSFYSSFYQNHGRLALSREMLREAQDRVRALNALEVEMRFIMQGLTLFADLEAWPVLHREIQRAEVTLKRCEVRLGAEHKTAYVEQIDKFRAIYWSATGACAEAESLAESVITRMERRPLSYLIANSQLQLSQVLRRCGSLERARAILDEGATRAKEQKFNDILEELEVAKAELYFLLEDYRSCRAAIDSSFVVPDRDPGQSIGREDVQRDVLYLKLALAAGDSARARQLLPGALARLNLRWKDLEPSADAALALPAATELGDLAHDLLDGSPESGYALELGLRLGQAGATKGSVVSENLARLSARNAAHCVYRVEHDRVLRWVAYEGRIVRDEIPIPTEDLTRKVVGFRRFMSNDSEPGERDPTRGYDLASGLLPAFVLQGEGPSEILITPDGPLEHLTFEALNLSPCAYAPLMSRRDVAYVLLTRSSGSAMNPSVVVVADPAYPAELKRRYSILTEALPDGAHEASVFASQFGNSVPLSGKQATKRNLLEVWENAGALYFACHTLRDPEIPYLMFIPMAGDPSEPGERLYLDVKDVRSADLSGCKLVVLSSCQTGTSYVTGRVSVPSLARAFVEAGAQAVINTSWDVEDEVAAEVMHAFATAYAEAPGSPVGALNDARRRLLDEGKPASVWASYSILLGGF